MRSLNPGLWTVLAVFVILAPSPAQAQTVASSFEELRQLLKKGQTVVVTDASGQQIRGKVGDLSPSSLTVLIPDARTFGEDAVAEVRRPNSWKKGALIGAGVGAGLAIWDYSIDPSEPGNAAITAVAIGLGTAIGAGIDALVGKDGKLLYRPRQRTFSLAIAPLARADRQGVLVSVRF
jgi:hypothetical protein